MISSIFFFSYLAPFVNEMVAAHPTVSFIKVDKEIFVEAAALYDIKMVPAFVFVSGDKVVSKVKYFPSPLY